MLKNKFLKYILPLLLGLLLAKGAQASGVLPGSSSDPIVSKTYIDKAVAEKLGPLEAELAALKAIEGQKPEVFSDIANSWAKNEITYLYERNIISGRGDNTFSPGGILTRAEFAKMIVSAAGVQVPNITKSRFPDVSQSWQIAYVEAAADNNFIVGDEKGNFNPNKPINRQEMAIILVRALGREAEAKTSNYEVSAFIDSNSISSWAKGYVAIAKEQGLINGRLLNDGNYAFAPLDSATRQEAAKIVYEFMNTP